MAKINAESFKQKLIDIGVDERHIKIEMDNKATNYDETHGIDMYQ